MFDSFFYVFSHANRPERRARNEDAVLAVDEVRQGQLSYDGIIPTDRPCIFAISDGLHITPTAACASHTLLSLLRAIWQDDPGMTPGRKIHLLSSRYCATVSGHPEREGMACTLLAAEIRDTQIVLYHVGDSRASLIREGRITSLTRDQTVLERLVRDGEVSPDEVEQHASIYDGLDNYFVASPFEEPPDCDIKTFTLEKNDHLLLASDGLSVLTPRSIMECVVDKPDDTAAMLFERAVLAGSDDNISMILLRFEDSEKPKIDLNSEK